MFWSKWFKRKQVKRIAFLDGDQGLNEILTAYDRHLANTGTETHLVRLVGDDAPEPRVLQKRNEFNKIYLRGYRTRKENTDKFIGAYIQKAVGEGYGEITVVSSDYDFIDVFKMAVVLNPQATNIQFRIIVPHARGDLADMPEQLANIRVIRDRKTKQVKQPV